ncbi:hypothetical protein SUGI_0795370 [Cryptomeria japonica]|nr:hypothetical protein SUGI_0795370 [Cryptomeria japonica]
MVQVCPWCPALGCKLFCMAFSDPCGRLLCPLLFLKKQGSVWSWQCMSLGFALARGCSLWKMERIFLDVNGLSGPSTVSCEGVSVFLRDLPLDLETGLVDFFPVLVCPPSMVEELFLCWSMTVLWSFLICSLPSLFEVALSPIEAKIWWLGAVGFLPDTRVSPKLMFCLLSIPIEVDLFPIEVGRWLGDPFKTLMCAFRFLSCVLVVGVLFVP